MSASRCPTGCNRSVRPGMLMCRPCWGEVPPDLQRDVYRTWRAFQSAKVRSAEDDEAAWRAYLAARDAAIASIA